MVASVSSSGSRSEPDDVRMLREATNRDGFRVLPIANGHSVVLCPGEAGGVVATCSPEEEGCTGPLHWDTYAPSVADPENSYVEYAAGKTKFSSGLLSAKAMAGERSLEGEYKGGRVISRLTSLGLPSPEMDETDAFRRG